MDDLPVNITDIAVAIVLLVSAFLAYSRGFVHEVLSVGGWVGAGFITLYSFAFVQPYAREIIAIELLADLATGVIVFVVTLAVLSLLTRAISKRVQDSALNALDRSLGFLFGLARGAVVVCLVYLGVEWMIPPDEQPTWLRSARTMPVIETGAHWLRSLVPAKTAAEADRAATDVQEQARKIEEARKLMEGLVSPSPKGEDAGTTEGYGAQIRKEMERLIDSNSQ